MADGLSPVPDPVPPSPRTPWPGWARVALGLGGGLLVGGGLAGVWGYGLLRQRLPDFLEANLSAALGRPIKVGAFQRLNLTGVRLGPSIVPPTEDDFSWVRATALEVSFNPLTLIFQRTLRPSLVFVEPQVSIKQGFDGEWRVQAPQSSGERGLIKTELSRIQIRDAELAIGPVSRSSIVELPEGVSSATLIVLQNVNLRAQFRGANNQTVALVVGGRLSNGAFQLRGEGQLDTRQTNLALQAQQIPIDLVNPLFGGDLFLRDGLLSANLDLKLRPEASDPLTVTGTARLRNGDVVLSSLPSPIQAINGTLVAQGVGGRIENSSLRFGPLLVRAEGEVDLHQGHDLRVTLPNFSLQEVATALGQSLPLEPRGQLQIKTHITGELLQPQVTGRLENLDPLTLNWPEWDLPGLNQITADFVANRSGLTLTQAAAIPSTGGRITAQGHATLPPNTWGPPTVEVTAQTDLPLDGLVQRYGLALPTEIRLGSLLAQAQVSGTPADLSAQADWQLPQATWPGRGRLFYRDRQLQAQDTRFQVGGGHLDAQASARLDSLDWRATLAGSALGLAALSPQLRGTLDTHLQAQGNLRTLTPEGIRAEGQLRLSEGVPLAQPGRLGVVVDLVSDLFPGALQARFAWTGRRLEIPEATAPNLYASGGADVAFLPGGGWPQVSNLDLMTRLSKIDLGSAYGALGGPEGLQPRGYATFEGTLRGNLDRPRLAGTLGLRQLALNNLALFDDVRGPVRASLTEGATVNLRGGATEMAAAIDPDLRPHRLRLTNGDFVVEGQRRGNQFEASLRHFDVGTLALRPLDNPDLGLLRGVLNASAQVALADWRNPQLAAQVDVERPGIGAIVAQRLAAQLHYRDGIALITGGHLDLSPSTQFGITGSGRLWPDWQATAEVTTAGADIQDLLYALNLYDYRDLGRLLTPLPLGQSADLATEPVGQPQRPLLDQADLARAIADQGQQRQAERDRALLPSLDQLEGQIAGRFGIAASRRQGLAADVHLTGQNWAWGRYDFDNQFVAQGQLRDQRISLQPLAFRAGETQLRLEGDVALQDSALALRAANLPLSAAASLLEIPVEVAGLLNLNADLTGSYRNPQLLGQITVDQASLNQQPIQEISATFGYQNAQFQGQGIILGAGADPLRLSGTVPYALPFMAVQPPSDQINLRASLQGEAFSLVNLFTPALVWDGGAAQADFQVGGTLQQPDLTGIATFDRATISSPALGTALDNLTGQVEVVDNQIRLHDLRGTLWDGQVWLTGQLPLLPPQGSLKAGDPIQENPAPTGIQVALQDLNLNIANEIRSRINGTLTVTHALLAPTLGGLVQVQDTQVTVGPELRRIATTFLDPSPRVAALANRLRGLEILDALHLDHLRLQVPTARAKAPPLFSFLGSGDVALSGPLSAPYAEGYVSLLEGWVQTITAEFFLETGHDNQILFTQATGIDPYLDLIMTATVPLQRSYNINRRHTITGQAEIPDIDVLGSNTIFDELLIEARLQGQASSLFDSLVLTSVPSYGQDQLLSMVSGGYLSDLGGTEPSLALASNLISALTADAQDSVGRALGLQRFRVNATTIVPSANNDTLAYGIGASTVIDRNLSLSLVQVLNQGQPIQLNARYRLDSQWGVRGSTNFGNDSRMLLEYRLNF